LLVLFIVTLAPIAYFSIRIAGTYLPNNYDSLTYHLPRAMYYLGEGNLGHFDTGNPRQIYFPFNYNLLQLFGLIYSPPFQVLNFINLITWGIAGLAIYRLCRLSALSANTALIACWMALTSTQVLAQATATTNDLPMGAGLLCSLMFALRWRQHRQTRDALLAGLLAGLAAGSKLTFVFFGPMVGLIILSWAYQHWREEKTSQFIMGVKAWILPACLALVLASPFALINIAEKGQWINNTYDFTLNRPFTFGSAVQTAEAYLVQLFIEPLHRFTFNLQFTGQLNTWGQQTFFPNWNPTYAFSPLYLFPPDLNEDHVWFGFVGPIILLSAIFCVVRFRKMPAPIVWLALLGLGWFVTYFLMNKWSLYNQRYFLPVILIMSPCIAAAIELLWKRISYRRVLVYTITILTISSIWLAGVYLFKNTSRPYAPIWASDPIPPALPSLPPLMAERLVNQTRINIDSTAGNERIFLLMHLAKHQRFTSSATPATDTYNVFSEWGFPRKVAYSNIEQRSSYTTVNVPAKKTAGVEYLGTIGKGQPAQDYYGLIPHPGSEVSIPSNRNILVVLNYGPREPDRYAHMSIAVAGLNPPDHARLIVGIEYKDGTSEALASFTSTGRSSARVTRPLHRFTIRVEDLSTQAIMGSTEINYRFRALPPDLEASSNPNSLFTYELINLHDKSPIVSRGLGEPEGPYPQWNLPLIRWANEAVVQIKIPSQNDMGLINISFGLRAQNRDAATVDVLFNGELIRSYQLSGHTIWKDDLLQVRTQPGENVIEFRNVVVGKESDWLDYLQRYPDVKAYVKAQHEDSEAGARAHYEFHGKDEGRVLNMKRATMKIDSEADLYYVFRKLQIEGFRKK